MGKYFTPDHGGIEQILTGAGCQAMVDGVASKVAADVRSQMPGADVVTETYTFVPTRRAGRRAAASVTVRRADARLRQIRDGILTRAAARQGAEVRDDLG